MNKEERLEYIVQYYNKNNYLEDSKEIDIPPNISPSGCFKQNQTIELDNGSRVDLKDE